MMKYLSPLASFLIVMSFSYSMERPPHLSPRTNERTSFRQQNSSDFWDIQRRGANFFNRSPSHEWFAAARANGIEFARLAPDKWHCAHRDFLIGNADAFEEISAQDYDFLKKVLDDAHKNNVKIIITLLSLPGSRWRQNNNGKQDLRIWQDENYKKQARAFWKKLAELLRDHPAVAGYNILNEPHPELLSGIEDHQGPLENWHASIAGTPADLNLFYRDIIQAIREVDANTPIIIDTGMYASPLAIRYLTPIDDLHILYSFHMYEPYVFTTRNINNGRYAYPGIVPCREDAEGICAHWDRAFIAQFLDPIRQWQRQHDIPSSRILVGEFGCDRTSQGAATYLADLTELFNTHGWHWAFYSFREDNWDSMDYELGTGEICWQYWQAIENGENLDRFRSDNRLFDAIRTHLRPPGNH